MQSARSSSISSISSTQGRKAERNNLQEGGRGKGKGKGEGLNPKDYANLTSLVRRKRVTQCQCQCQCVSVCVSVSVRVSVGRSSGGGGPVRWRLFLRS